MVSPAAAVQQPVKAIQAMSAKCQFDVKHYFADLVASGAEVG